MTAWRVGLGCRAVSESRPGKDAVLHLRVPQGTPAMWVEKVSAYGAGEREILLGRGLQWKATRVVREGGQWHVYGEVL
ncbi:ADP-ribosyltransferase [Kitasatospora sp. NPDC048540]|uniref:ADP-ribosyltransferase n=1 Tax=Kitasatospora sp. NPDC048540 TaxID=3155634 RepID=UPI0033F5921F